MTHSIYLDLTFSKTIQDYEYIDFINKKKDNICELSLNDVNLLERYMKELDEKLIETFNHGIYELYYSTNLQQRKNVLNGVNNTPLCFSPYHRFPFDVVNDYPEIDKIRLQMVVIESLSKEDLLKLKNTLVNLQTTFLKSTGNIGTLDMGAYRGLIVFDPDIKRCNELLKRFSETNYNTDEAKVVMSEDENVNGYKLYNTHKKDIFTEDMFMEYLEMWDDNKEMTLREFNKKFDDVSCSEWSKMDRHGECFGGYWKYPEGTYERKNAFSLCREDNMNGLYELPYPKEFVLMTVSMGCNTRLESVRYSNAVCEWYRRKRSLLNDDKDNKNTKLIEIVN